MNRPGVGAGASSGLLVNGHGWGRQRSAPGAHHLVAAGEILYRRAPDVNQPGEREDKEDSHSQHQMDAIHPRDAVQMRRCAAVEGDYRLRPIHQFSIRCRPDAGRRTGWSSAQRALNQQNAQDQDIRSGGGGANARVGQAARQQANTADQSQYAADTAQHHRHYLFLRHRQEP